VAGHPPPPSLRSMYLEIQRKQVPNNEHLTMATTTLLWFVYQDGLQPFACCGMGPFCRWFSQVRMRGAVLRAQGMGRSTWVFT
jgi:hypothetical protein